MLKKLFLTLFAILLFQTGAFADEITDVKNFFQSYVDAANSYSHKVVDFYLPNAKITRVVHKKDGTKVAKNFPMSEYAKQMKMGAAAGKIAGYKNTYTNRVVTKVGNDFKLSATRTPGDDKTGLPCHFIITNTPSGYKFKEESMDTTVQKFLK